MILHGYPENEQGMIFLCFVCFDQVFKHFTGTLTAGNGITAELLLKEGITVYHEENWDEPIMDE